jgi:hypothetical protein
MDPTLAADSDDDNPETLRIQVERIEAATKKAALDEKVTGLTSAWGPCADFGRLQALVKTLRAYKDNVIGKIERVRSDEDEVEEALESRFGASCKPVVWLYKFFDVDEYFLASDDSWSLSDSSGAVRMIVSPPCPTTSSSGTSRRWPTSMRR